MFNFFKKLFSAENDKGIGTIMDILTKRSEEIETGEWIAHAIVSSDGLKIFSREKNTYYKVDRLFPYGVKIFDTVSKFHEKSGASLQGNLFKKTEVVIYRTESMEEVFILKHGGEEFSIYLIWICDPTLVSAGFSTDKVMAKLSSWLESVVKEMEAIIKKRKEKYET